MKYLFTTCAVLLLVACSPRNEHYYQTHPQALQEAIKSCPANPPSQLSCDRLTGIAITTNELAYQLQSNPQVFGKKILSLQETIAKQEATLKANPKQSDLQVDLNKNKLLLEQHMAVVRWLESPES